MAVRTSDRMVNMANNDQAAPKGWAAAWRDVNDGTIGTKAYWTIAIQNWSFFKDMAPLIAEHVSGSVLDLGAGQMAWRTELTRASPNYQAADLEKTHEDIEFIVDLTKTLPFDNDAYDTVFCCSVLEHLIDFSQALSEMHRILKPGGRLILSVPFLFYRHGDPHDYFRFTSYAIRHLAKAHGYELAVLRPTGGLAELVVNPVSMALSSALWKLRLRSSIGPLTRAMTAIVRWLDGMIDRDRRFAQNHIAVLRKPSVVSS